MILIEFHRFETAVIYELQKNLTGYLKKYEFSDCMITATDITAEKLLAYGFSAPTGSYIRISHDHATRDITELVRVIQAYPRHQLYGYGILINSTECYVPPDRAGHLP